MTESLKLNVREKISQLKFAHKLSRKPGNLVNHSGRTLRSNRNKLLNNPTANNTKFEKSFMKKGIKIWNLLPEDIKGITNIHKFKTRVVSELRQGKLNFPE